MKKTIIRFMIVISISFGFIGLPTVFANNPLPPKIESDNGPKIKLPKPIDKSVNDLPTARNYFAGEFIPRLFTFLFGGTSIIALIFLLIGGIRFVASYGNEELASSAKKTVQYSLIGLAVSLLSYTVVVIINNLASVLTQGNPPSSP